MSVTLNKSSDNTIYGGHNRRTAYTKTAEGAIPEYALAWRRREMHGVQISWDQSYDLRSNHLCALSDFFGGRL